jgi:hypothetical protein
VRERLATRELPEPAQDPASLAVGLRLAVVLPIADWPARLFPRAKGIHTLARWTLVIRA